MPSFVSARRPRRPRRQRDLIAARSCRGSSPTMSTRSAPTQARYAALLTAQGKYLHDFMMVEAATRSILLDAEAAAPRRSQAPAVDLSAARQGRRSTSEPDACRGGGVWRRRPRRPRSARRARSRPALSARASPLSIRGWRPSARAASCRASGARPALAAERLARSRFRRLRPPAPRRSAFPTAAATWCSKNRSCSKRASTN